MDEANRNATLGMTTPVEGLAKVLRRPYIPAAFCPTMIAFCIC
jgi:hypothetical protein